ncbi:MAG: hypothetical protein ACI4BD_02575 [Paludibacteraceae bacterium]
MTYRPLADIFPPYYLGTTDEDTLRRVVDMHLNNCYSVEDLHTWISRRTDPYEREAYAVLTIRRIQDRSRDPDDDFLLNPDLFAEAVEPRLRYIIRHAQTDQLADEMLYREAAHGVCADTPRQELNSRFERMEKQVAYLAHEVEKMKAGTLKTDTCPYIIPSPVKSQDDIEADLRRFAALSAQKFIDHLHRMQSLRYLDFGTDSASDIYAHMDNCYHISRRYQLDTFRKAWRNRI